jgi:hypothetical protein
MYLITFYVYWNAFHYLLRGFVVRNSDISLILGVKKDHFLDTILKPHLKKKNCIKLASKSYPHLPMGYDKAARPLTCLLTDEMGSL